MTPVFFDDLSEAAFWVAGTGLAAILISLINISLWRADPEDSIIRRIGQVANFLLLILTMTGMSIMPGLRTYFFMVIALVMVGSASCYAIGGRKTEDSESDERQLEFPPDDNYNSRSIPTK